MTDRRAFAGSAEAQTRLLLEKMENAAGAGVDWIQIREKDLTGRELAALVAEAVRRIARPCRILVNDRLDVAMAVGAGGAHLGEQSMPIEDARRFVKEKNCGGDFLVGASAHSLEAAQAAEKDGADFVIFGPVYETPSKAAYGPPQGLSRLSTVCERVCVPVIAIGGITIQNARECTAAGASGIAAIRLFQDADDPAAVLRELRAG
ncbi:MAG TPA: thiamine phosphate synthase [Candidatus Acidoferrum sp.]|nr:thiamine phosphate synthase [Candidatus Acidoferrum sp.]